jgi:catechol 2,3-dioxygenase-like lactoylglutathione lyase family enzyme
LRSFPITTENNSGDPDSERNRIDPGSSQIAGNDRRRSVAMKARLASKKRPTIAVTCPVASILIAVASATSAIAQTSAPNLTGIAHVAIRVSDLEQSRAFFHKLGFEEAFAMDKGGSPTEAFFKVNDRQFIELYPRRDVSQAVGFMHICFEAADIDAVDQDYQAHGLVPTPVKRAGAGNLLFTLQGPEEPGPPSDLRPAPTQNIEYTQYMAGSRHTLDRGQHLGLDRIADRIAGVGIPMADPAAAASFYLDKLSFARAAQSLEPGIAALMLPGAPGQRIEFLPPFSGQAPNALSFRLIFSVPDLRPTTGRLHALGLPAKKHGPTVIIQDPEGDSIAFIRTAKESP